jgi:hypothetical protein
MISTSKTLDDDLKRAFVLFIIGVVLTTITQIHVHWSYIQVVQEVKIILK